MRFTDRYDAGRQLGLALQHLRGEPVVVLGLPRGGVPVAFEVARALAAPLDVIVVRKLGLPSNPELGMGALAEGGVRVIDADLVAAARVTEAEIGAVEARERAELERRALRFRGGRPPAALAGRVAVVVDDGVATGSTARAACRAARARGAVRVVLAVPVAPRDWQQRIGGDADELVCLAAPTAFLAVGQFYVDFGQTPDDEVVSLLQRAAALQRASAERPAVDPSGASPHPVDAEVDVGVGGACLAGRLTVPSAPRGVVAFAHGSGSSHHSPRNRYVAAVLQEAGLETLLFDLLDPEEAVDRGNVFDVALLADRLLAAGGWLRGRPEVGDLPLGYFGASTGAAAALWAAAEPGNDVAAVVSRGGRPDLALGRLAEVRAPTLLIVGGEDRAVLELNLQAATHLRCEHHVSVVPGAAHLFDTPGALPLAAHMAAQWFAHHLVGQPAAAR